jgi:ribosomal protein S18 acetylase RimI-like enzyme
MTHFASEPISYQLVTRDRLDDLLALVKELHEMENIPFNETSDRKVLLNFLNNEMWGRSWFIYQHNILIGYTILTFTFSIEFRGCIACVDELYLKEQHRGQGIGEQTLKFVEDTCRAIAIETIYLEVARNNDRAQNFYRRVGYRERNYYFMLKNLS